MRPDAPEETPLSITDLENPSLFVDCQFNPMGMQWGGKAVYSRKRPSGATGERIQFMGNPNEERSLKLFFAALDAPLFDKLTFARNFLQSLIRPPSSPQSIAQNTPPDVLLTWNNNTMVVGKLLAFSAFDSQMDTEGRVLRHETIITFMEQYRQRLTSDIVRAQGVIRAVRV